MQHSERRQGTPRQACDTLCASSCSAVWGAAAAGVHPHLLASTCLQARPRVHPTAPHPPMAIAMVPPSVAARSSRPSCPSAARQREGVAAWAGRATMARSQRCRPVGGGSAALKFAPKELTRHQTVGRPGCHVGQQRGRDEVVHHKAPHKRPAKQAHHASSDEGDAQRGQVEAAPEGDEPGKQAGPRCGPAPASVAAGTG